MKINKDYLFGIDISKWQDPKTIDYDKLAKELDFSILRVGFTGHNNGANPRNFNLDTTFDTHYSELKKRGVPLGVYWYGGAKTFGEVDSEINLMMKALKGKTFEYPVYYDVEENLTHGKLDKKDLTDITVNWCDKVKAKGYNVGVYANLSWFNTKLEVARLTKYDIWLAHWVKEPGMKCDMWQYSSDGNVNGYNGRLDVNYAYKEYGKVKPVAPTPKPTPTVNAYQKPKGTYGEVARFTNTTDSNIYMRQFVPNVNGANNGKLAPNKFVDYQDVYFGNGYVWVGNGTTWIPTAELDGNGKVKGKAWGAYKAVNKPAAKPKPSGNWKLEKATFILGTAIYERNQPNVNDKAGMKLIPKGTRVPYDAFSVQGGYVWLRKASDGKVIPWRVQNGTKWGKIV
jgi:GH25 family lysozyme M1 (1,4-beta-N-acetylmuramidase)